MSIDEEPNKTPSFTADERIFENAWLLGDDVLEGVVPGDEERLSELLGRSSLALPGEARSILLPREGSTGEIDEELHVRVLEAMRNPEWFPFTCKWLLDINIFPFQHCILKELWTRPFPMLIASRGAGKSYLMALYIVLRLLITQGVKIVVVGSAFRQAKVVFEYVEQIWSNAPVLRDLCGGGKGRNNREQGPRRDIDRCECIIGDSVVVALPLGDGRKIRGQRANVIVSDEFACLGPDTLVETDRGLIRIAETESLLGEFRLHLGSGRYASPTEFIRTPPTDVWKVTTDSGYSFLCSSIHKVMTTDGWKIAKDLTREDRLVHENTYEFPEEYVVHDDTVLDENLAWLLGVLIAEGHVATRHGLSVKTTDEETASTVRERLSLLIPPDRVKTDEHPPRIDPRGWRCRKAYTVRCCHLAFREKLLGLGLDRVVAGDKKIPWSILRSPRSVVIAFLSGLFDGDGSAFLWKDRNKENVLGVAYYTVSERLAEEVHVLLAKLGIFSSRRTRPSKLSPRLQWIIRLNGENAHALCGMLDVPRWRSVVERAIPPSPAGKRGRGASGVEGVIRWGGNRWKAEVAGGKRRRKYLGVFARKEDAVVAVQRNHPARSLAVKSVELLPDKMVLYDFRVPVHECFQAAGFLQHNSINPEIYETVVKGFGSVTQSPVENAREEARVRLLKKLGRWTPAMEEASRGRNKGNQAIIAGTASYSFNWFYKYWCRYKAIIESKGDPAKLAELDPDGKVDPSLDWRDYSIIRIPVDLLPPGMMDPKIIASSRATSHKSVHLMEYGSCLLPGTKVTGPRGPIAIQEIVPGDEVLTHEGRFRKVVKVTGREIDEDVLVYRTLGYGEDVGVTAEHPLWGGGERWFPAADLGKGVVLRSANLRETNGRRTLDVRDFTTGYRCRDGRLWPKSSRSRVSDEDEREILASDESDSVVARRLGVGASAVWAIRAERRPPKNSIPAVLPLDRLFGEVVGWYASEGSVGADGRCVQFALDGHHDVRLEKFVDDLSVACEGTFGFRPKDYRHKKNLACITINSRLVADLLSGICPGVSHDKCVDPDVLFSNEDFLAGFLRGYWNGDGHRSSSEQDRILASAVSASPALAWQIRTALSFFGISSAVGPRTPSSLSERTHWAIQLYGKNAEALGIRIFGDEKVVCKGGVVAEESRLKNDGTATLAPVVRVERVRHRGWVYNLEVEEDHSYTLANATVHNCFPVDSDGFFKRSLIESCVAGNPGNDIPLEFSASLVGEPGIRHVMGVDPASESDNFAVVLVALHPDHRRVVHVWTTRKKDFQDRQRAGLTRETTFFSFVVRKIRDLMRDFSVERIVMDAQGGGYQVEEALHDSDKLRPGEQPIWRVKEEDPRKRRDSDSKAGLHVLEMVQFADASWVSEANNGLKKDLEDRVLLFPRIDSALLGLAVEEDKEVGRTSDTLEDAAMEVEALKDELAAIEHTATPGGRERWDLPAKADEGGKVRKTRRRKDRYSALLLANTAARRGQRGPKPLLWNAGGGWAVGIAGSRGTPPGTSPPAAPAREDTPPENEEPLYVLGEGWAVSDAPGAESPLADHTGSGPGDEPGWFGKAIRRSRNPPE